MGPGCLLGLRQVSLGCLLVHRRMSLVCPWAVPGFLWGFVICVWDAILVHRRMSLVCILVDPWCLWDFGICILVASLGHRRMALVCLLVDPGCFRGFVTCVMGASWVIIVCVFCVPLGWSLGPSDASSYTPCVPIDTSSYVSCVPPGWALDDTVASSGKSRVPLGTPSYGSCVPLGGAWAPTGLRHMRLGWLLGQRRVSLVSPLVGSSGKSRAPLVASSYVSCVLLVGSLVPLGLRHLRLGYLVGHRRMFLARLLVNL